jgi:hypothetical protein
MLCLLLCGAFLTEVEAASPAPPTSISVHDVTLDAGDALEVMIDASSTKPIEGVKFVVQKSMEQNGVYKEAATVDASAVIKERLANPFSPRVPEDLVFDAEVGDIPSGKPVWFRAYAVNAAGEKSPYTYSSEPGIATQQFFDGNRFWFFIVTLFVCGSVVAMILVARSGVPMWIRKISALDAIDEAVGRATEMGKSCLFVTGVQDLNEIETIAGITVLSRVAQKAAEYDATVIVPTSRSLVMTAARETSQAAYLAAGRPDAYQEDRIYYVTDDQFGFVAHLSGYMQREKPAACFYMGQFYAESLLLGETGNAIGAIQIAGTAQPAQLPFFVAACDYTLIGEEFFAASAYLSRDPDQLGSLKGQDIGKLLVMAILFVGVTLVTVVNVTLPETPGATPSGLHAFAKTCADYLQNHILQSS